MGAHDHDDELGVLPDQGVVVGLAGVLVPDEGGLALVGHTDGRNVIGVDLGLLQASLDHVLGAFPDLHRVMLYPASLRVELWYLQHGARLVVVYGERPGSSRMDLLRQNNLVGLRPIKRVTILDPDERQHAD